MVSRKAPFGLMLIAPVIFGLGVYAFTGQDPVDPAPGSETPTATASPDATPTRTSVVMEPTPLSPPVAPPTAVPAQRGQFRDGAWVRVVAGAGDCLNARWSPGVDAEYTGVNVCLPDGFEGLITGQPQEAEGRWWWYMPGAGFVAEEFLQYMRDAELSSAMAPQFAAAPGLIAFLREGEVWLMRPDGSDQHMIVPARMHDGYSVWPTQITWSPDGTRLSYNVTLWDANGGVPASELHVVDTAGNLVTVVHGVAGRSWSPDSARIAVVTGSVNGGMGGGWQGVPGYLDVATGAITAVAADALPWSIAWQSDGPQFNHDGTRLLITYSYYDESTQMSQNGLLVTDLAGSNFIQYTPPAGEWVNAAVWSPVTDVIALYRGNDNGESRYEVMDLNFGTLASAPVPAWAPNRSGGCGGGAEMNRPAWRRDGSRLMFGFMYGEAGTNGIWSLDVASGGLSLLPVANTYNAAAGPDTLAVFSDGGHVFVGDTNAGYPSLITDGHSPVWSSGQ